MVSCKVAINNGMRSIRVRTELIRFSNRSDSVFPRGRGRISSELRDACSHAFAVETGLLLGLHHDVAVPRYMRYVPVTGAVFLALVAWEESRHQIAVAGVETLGTSQRAKKMPNWLSGHGIIRQGPGFYMGIH